MERATEHSDDRAATPAPSEAAHGSSPAPRGLLALQATAGNAAVAGLLGRPKPRRRPAPRPAPAVQRSLVVGPADASERHTTPGGGGAPSEPAPMEAGAQAQGVGSLPDSAAADAAPPGGGDSGGDSGAPAGGPGGGDGGAAPPGGGEPPGGGAGAPAGGGAPPGGGGGGGAPAGGAPAGGGGAGFRPATLDPQGAGKVADFVAAFGTQPPEHSPAAAAIVAPAMRQAAATLLPERARDLGLPPAEETPGDGRSAAAPQPAGAAPAVQRQAAGGTRAVQRDNKGTGTIPTRKVSMTVPNWQPIPLFKDRNLGSWFLLSGSVESPKWEGSLKPPDSLRDDTKEQDLQATADGKVSGYAATFHKETIAKVGEVNVDGKLAVEATSKSVKVSGLQVDLPNLGPQGSLVQGQIDFDILDWPAGQPPSVMALSYTQKIGIESKFTKDGWEATGQLYLPIKLTIKPNPAKVAQFVARVLGPRLAAAAPGMLAAGAPIFAGAACVTLWVNAVQAGKDFAAAHAMAKSNTLGYITGYFDTIYGYKQRYDNAGSKQGIADAERVLKALRWDDLDEGAKQKIRDEYLAEGTLDLGGAQAAAWKRFRGAALAWYRENHSVDAWMYDKGLGGDLAKLERFLDRAGPPWSMANY